MRVQGLEPVAKAAESWEVGRVDETLLFEDISLVADETFGGDFVKIGDDGQYRGLSMHGRSQLFKELKLPESYLSKCPTALRQAQYDYWLDQKSGDEARLWRSLGQNGPVLGILPTTYADVPYSKIVEVVGSTNFDLPMKVFSFDRTPTHFRLILVGGERLVSLSSNRELFPGIVIVASDVGACNFIHSDFLFDSACTNGTVLGKEIGFTNTVKHKGDAITKAKESLLAASQSFPSRLASIPAIVNRAVDQVTTDGKKMVNKLITLGVKKALAEDIWNEAREEMRVREGLETRPITASLWDVASAITRLARTQVADPIQRWKMEEAAGRLLVAV